MRGSQRAQYQPSLEAYGKIWGIGSEAKVGQEGGINRSLDLVRLIRVEKSLFSGSTHSCKQVTLPNSKRYCSQTKMAIPDTDVEVYCACLDELQTDISAFERFQDLKLLKIPDWVISPF